MRGSLAGVRETWDRLVDQSPLPSPFLRSWWLDAVAGELPRFVLVFDGASLAGGVPLEEDRVLGLARLRLIGQTLGADHLDLVARPDRVADVVAALAGWFAGRRNCIIDLVGAVPNARMAQALSGPVRRDVIDSAPWDPLPSTLDEYLTQRPPELKNLVQRPLRRLERAGVEHRVVDAAGCQRALDALRAFHGRHWADQSMFLPEFSRFEGAAPTGVEHGDLVIHELAVDGVPIAVTVFFHAAGRASFYQTGRSDERPWRGSGTALMALAVAHACENGCHELDLLRGDERYKALWASRSREVVRLQAAYGRRARSALRVLPLAARGKRRVRRLASRAPWLKK